MPSLFSRAEARTSNSKSPFNEKHGTAWEGFVHHNFIYQPPRHQAPRQPAIGRFIGPVGPLHRAKQSQVAPTRRGVEAKSGRAHTQARAHRASAPRERRAEEAVDRYGALHGERGDETLAETRSEEPSRVVRVRRSCRLAAATTSCVLPTPPSCRGPSDQDSRLRPPPRSVRRPPKADRWMDLGSLLRALRAAARSSS